MGVLRRWHLALPAALTVFFAFDAGGFFPLAPAIAALCLALLLVGRITLAARPFEGWSVPLALAGAGLAGLAVCALTSAAWSDAPGRALVEFDRALMYLLALVVAGSAAREPGSLAAVLRWMALAIVVVGVAALLTRLLPETFPTSPNIVDERLSFPLTYWNALGILLATGVVLLVHLSASCREHAAVRVLAAGALPAVAVGLYFSFSRGGIGAAVLGVLAYAALARARGLVPAALALVPAAGLALQQAYAAEVLARADFRDVPAAIDQGSELALVVLACCAGSALLRALALPLDARLERVRLPERLRVPVLAGAAALALACLASAAVAADLPDRLRDARATFAQGDLIEDTGDLRDRLTQLGNNGRIIGWRVARDAFEREPLLGTGAGTFELEWERERRYELQIVDAHSLYLEVLAELGVAGLAMLVLALGALGFGAARGLGGDERHARGALLAAGAAVLLHAGVDWDWEMPAVMAWLFGAGAVAAAAPPGAGRIGDLGRLPRVLGGLACLLIAVTPALMIASQSALERAQRAFAAGDCRTAVDGALSSIEALSVRAEPYELLGYCNARGGADDLAVRAMASAARRDPGNWRYAYGLAVTRALAGEDPVPAALEARRLNPQSTLARELAGKLRAAESRARRRAIAARARIPEN